MPGADSSSATMASAGGVSWLSVRFSVPACQVEASQVLSDGDEERGGVPSISGGVLPRKVHGKIAISGAG